MHVTKCLEVVVRFVRVDKQTVAIRHTHGDSRSRYLRIEHDAIRLHIAYCDKDGDEIGSINYNSAEVLGYDCIGWVK